MRTIFLAPLTALAAVVAGCGSEASEPAARSAAQRDLTLMTQTAQVEIASPVETQEARPAARLAPARRSRPREPKIVLAAVAAPVPVTAEPVARPASASLIPEERASPASDRELLPGKTVTVIPASSGPSAGPDQTDDYPTARGRTMVRGGGGTCRGRGRGPGIGIAAAPRPDFRGRR
jgi:hypothetical protein